MFAGTDPSVSGYIAGHQIGFSYSAVPKDVGTSRVCAEERIHEAHPPLRWMSLGPAMYSCPFERRPENRRSVTTPATPVVREQRVPRKEVKKYPSLTLGLEYAQKGG